MKDIIKSVFIVGGGLILGAFAVWAALTSMQTIDRNDQQDKECIFNASAVGSEKWTVVNNKCLFVKDGKVLEVGL